MTDSRHSHEDPSEPSPGSAEETPAEKPSETAGDRTVAWDPEDLPELAEAGGDPTTEDDPMIGRIIRNKWRVLERLGAGSFGTVYKVRDEKGGWVEALKILSVDRLHGAEAENARKRFLREARIMKRLGAESPHIVGLSTYEEDVEAGLVYFLMELVEGKSLSRVLREEGPFPVERTIRIALQICDALVVAHEGPDGIVHRDLKLENVMLTRDRSGQEIAKVLDFGIAKIAERDPDSRLTTAGTLGTPGYAAPEQLRAQTVDARTDLFAVGVILYALLTGRDPWLGRPAGEPTDQVYELMSASDRAEVRPMEETGVDVPPAMIHVVQRLLRRDPDARFASASQLRAMLERMAAGGGDEAWGSIRILTEPPGVRVEVRSGRKVVSQGSTPCVANGLEPGSYRARVVDPRYEPLETKVDLQPGSMEDLNLLARERSTGLLAAALRNPGPVAAVLVLLLVGGGLAIARPWGVELSTDEVRRLAADGDLQAVRVGDSGLEGRAAGSLLPLFFELPLAREETPAVVRELREAGIPVDASAEVERLIEDARRAQAQLRYFGPGESDVRDLAERVAAMDPDNPVAGSLLLKVAERMAWDAEAAAADGSMDVARDLIRECLGIAPDHPSCLAARADLEAPEAP